MAIKRLNMGGVIKKKGGKRDYFLKQCLTNEKGVMERLAAAVSSNKRFSAYRF